MARTRSAGARRPRGAVAKEEGVATGHHAIEEDHQVVAEATPAPDTTRREPAPEKIEMNVVKVDGEAAKIGEAEGEKHVPDQQVDVKDVIPMDEEAAKKDRKRGREKEEEVEDDAEKSSKAVKTETTAAENGTPAVKVEDEVEDGVEVVQGAVIGDEEPGKTKRLKKKKIAMVVAYCGANYQGMQRNPGAITIEGDLEQALYRAGAITKENFGIPRKVDWMRAARTDKGVSAIGQIVSGQFIIEPEGFVERVNSFLPKDIVMLGYKRVTGSFNAKRLCDKRRYEYILPTYCFDPSRHLDRDTVLALRAEDCEEEEAKDGDGQKGGPAKAKEHTVDGGTGSRSKVKERHGKTKIQTENKEDAKPVEENNSSTQTEVEKSGPYKFDDAELNRLNRILARYKGTHNYHNFTARTQAEDPSALRYIIHFEAEDTVILDGVEYVRLHVVGQSFMLHQIRKMVGLAVAIMRGAAPESVMDFALRKDTKFNVPMAPELGLFLEECYYSSYNNKFKSSHEELSLRDYIDAVNEFKKNVIYPHIASTEASEKVFPLWLHGMNDRHYPDFVAAREGTYKPGNSTAGSAA